MYKKKLIELLKGLEVENIDELLKKGTPQHFRVIGFEIAKYAKIGSAIRPRILKEKEW